MVLADHALCRSVMIVKDTRSGISKLSLVLKYVIVVSRPSNLLNIVVLHARSVEENFYNLENM